jgi:hypothetical protein
MPCRHSLPLHPRTSEPGNQAVLWNIVGAFAHENDDNRYPGWLFRRRHFLLQAPERASSLVTDQGATARMR